MRPALPAGDRRRARRNAPDTNSVSAPAGSPALLAPVAEPGHGPAAWTSARPVSPPVAARRLNPARTGPAGAGPDGQPVKGGHNPLRHPTSAKSGPSTAVHGANSTPPPAAAPRGHCRKPAPLTTPDPVLMSRRGPALSDARACAPDKTGPGFRPPPIPQRRPARIGLSRPVGSSGAEHETGDGRAALIACSERNTSKWVSALLPAKSSGRPTTAR